MQNLNTESQIIAERNKRRPNKMDTVPSDTVF